MSKDPIEAVSDPETSCSELSNEVATDAADCELLVIAVDNVPMDELNEEDAVR